MNCAGCRKTITQAQFGPFAGELIDPRDGAPHRLTCSADRHLTHVDHSHHGAPCGHHSCRITKDRRGTLHRCKACNAWTYAPIVGQERHPNPAVPPTKGRVR